MASTRPKLDRDTIVDQAIRLMGEEGFDALSLRRLAARLGVQAPALYWHFPDRAALLGALVEALHRQVDAPMAPASRDDLGRWLVRRGLAMRALMRSIRDSARLLAEASNDGRRAERFRQMAEASADLDVSEVTRSVAVLYAYVVGWLHYEQQPAMRSFMAEVMDIDAAFRTGLDALAQGLVAQFERERGAIQA